MKFAQLNQQKKSTTAITDFCEAIDVFCGLMCGHASDEVYKKYQDYDPLSWLWKPAHTESKDSTPQSPKPTTENQTPAKKPFWRP